MWWQNGIIVNNFVKKVRAFGATLLFVNISEAYDSEILCLSRKEPT